MKKKLSLIVPVYRGEKYVRKSLLDIRDFLGKMKKNGHIVDFEIIAVIDGVVDRSYQEAAEVKNIRIISYSINQGKGYALVEGFKYCKGEVIVFMDADGDLPPEQIGVFLPYLATADLIVGSKRHPFSKVEYPWIRRVLSTGFKTLSRLILGIGIRDTQSGMKMIKREVLKLILPLVSLKQYAFDLELCFLAQKHGFRIVEAPVYINFKGRSSIHYRVAWSMFKDLCVIWHRYYVTRAYRKAFHSHYYSYPDPKDKRRGKSK